MGPQCFAQKARWFCRDFTSNHHRHYDTLYLSLVYLSIWDESYIKAEYCGKDDRIP